MRKLFFIAALFCASSMMAGSISDFQKRADIDYVGDNHTGHKLDVYYPNDDQTKHPVVIHIYGSAWSMNNMKGSAELNSVGVACLEAGYIYVTPNHRSYNDAVYPAQINDIKAVVRYLRGNASELGIDTSFIAVSGFSSGGHLAAQMGTTRNVEGEYTVGSATMDIEGSLGGYTSQKSWVHAVCVWSGMVDPRKKSCGNHETMDPENNLVGCNAEQCPDKHALIAANAYLDPTDAPTMIVHGSADNVVPYCEAQIFYDELRASSVDAEIYQHSGEHEVNADYLDEMVAFFNRIKAANSPSVLENTAVKSNANKFIRDGQLLLELNGQTYNVLGTQLQ